MKFKLLIILGILLSSISAWGVCSESFSWLPNSESNLKGYIIYHGKVDGGPYPNFTDVGNPITDSDGRVYGTVTGLVCGDEYYFVCVATNVLGVGSSYSDQVIVTTGLEEEAPLPPQDFRIEE